MIKKAGFITLLFASSAFAQINVGGISVNGGNVSIPGMGISVQGGNVQTPDVNVQGGNVQAPGVNVAQPVPEFYVFNENTKRFVPLNGSAYGRQVYVYDYNQKTYVPYTRR